MPVDGRMLRRAIATSRKLAELKSDSARLLYTWILPFLDVEGRYFADPLIIKGNIVPRIKSFTAKKIEECLKDMSDKAHQLVLLYRIDGDRYLQFLVFEKHQTLRKDREGASKIPPPPGGLREGSGGLRLNISQCNLSKVNIKEVNAPSHNPDFQSFPNAKARKEIIKAQENR